MIENKNFFQIAIWTFKKINAKNAQIVNFA